MNIPQSTLDNLGKHKCDFNIGDEISLTESSLYGRQGRIVGAKLAHPNNQNKFGWPIMLYDKLKVESKNTFFEIVWIAESYLIKSY